MLNFSFEVQQIKKNDGCESDREREKVHMCGLCLQMCVSAIVLCALAEMWNN